MLSKCDLVELTKPQNVNQTNNSAVSPSLLEFFEYSEKDFVSEPYERFAVFYEFPP